MHPPSIPHPHYRTWASANPTSLRTQLLFLLRDVSVKFRPWENESSAPGGTLPALHVGDRLLHTNEIRPWLDETHPTYGAKDKFHGLADQSAYDKALAIAQLVLSRLHPAYLPSPLAFPHPPPLLAGLTTPLPASLSGDARDMDQVEILRRGVEAINALDEIIGSGWALDAR
jgi:metaxin